MQKIDAGSGGAWLRYSPISKSKEGLKGAKPL